MLFASMRKSRHHRAVTASSEALHFIYEFPFYLHQFTYFLLRYFFSVRVSLPSTYATQGLPSTAAPTLPHGWPLGNPLHCPEGLDHMSLPFKLNHGPIWEKWGCQGLSYYICISNSKTTSCDWRARSREEVSRRRADRRAWDRGHTQQNLTSDGQGGGAESWVSSRWKAQFRRRKLAEGVVRKWVRSCLGGAHSVCLCV